MRISPGSTLLQALVRSQAWASDLFLIDVGASGGIASYWSVFGDRLRAAAFDPLVAEVERLNREEHRPGVRYEAAFVGFPGFDGLFPPDLRADRVRTRNNDPFPRVSAARAQALLSIDYVRDAYNRGAPAAVADRLVSLDEYLRPAEYRSVDFMKIDTDGHDIEVLLGAERLLTTGGLGLLVEVQLHGAVHDRANTWCNIDRYLRGLGFSLFDIELYRYTRASLPGPFECDLPAQTHGGQILAGDALYLRDLADPAYPQKHPFEVTGEHVLKLAALFALFGLPDCAAELLVARSPLSAPATHLLLDRAAADAGAGDYESHVAAFERDPRVLYPSRRAAGAAGPGAATTPSDRLQAARAENLRLKARLKQLKAKNEHLRQRLGRGSVTNS